MICKNNNQFNQNISLKKGIFIVGDCHSPLLTQSTTEKTQSTSEQ